MASPRYTILIVPTTKAAVRKLSVSSHFVSYVFIALALIAVGSFGMMIHYRNLHQRAQHLSRVQQENDTLKANLKHSEVITQQLNRKIVVLTRLTARLKTIAGLRPFAFKRRNAQAKLGVGGATMGSSFDPQELMSLKQKADLLERNLVGLEKHFSHRKNLPTTPSLIPVPGVISSAFGARVNPFTNLPDFHEGVDISNDAGTPVTATAAGFVRFAGIKGNLGLTIEIQHGEEVSTLFGHLQKILVHGGEYVSKGQTIGYLGNTGKSTGPHLHYEIQVNNQPVNPKRYLF